MKILVVGPYNTVSSAGRLTQEIILSLNEVNQDTFCKDYEYPKGIKSTNETILSLESKPINGVDILVECLPPPLMEYDRRCGLNVGVCDLPTYPPPLNYSNKANLLDLHLNTNFIKLGNKPSIVFTPSSDISKYSLEYPKIKELEEFKKDRFLFYSIGNHSKKSGFSDIFRALFTEFKYWEQVGLVLKVKSRRFNEKDLIDQIYKDIQMIQAGIGIYKTIPVMILTEDKYSEEQLHSSCDCYIDADHGFDFHFQSIDAIGFNKPVILSDKFQHSYKFANTANIVNSSHSRVYAAIDEEYSELYSGKQYWIEPNLSDLMLNMRDIFKNPQNITNDLSEFSRKKVGQRLLGIFNEQQKESNRSTRVGSK